MTAPHSLSHFPRACAATQQSRPKGGLVWLNEALSVPRSGNDVNNARLVGLLSSDWNLSLTPVELRKLLESARRDAWPDTAPAYERGRRPRQYQHRITSEDEKTILAQYAAGKTVCQIAEDLGCHRVTVSGVLRRHGHTMRHRSPEPSEIDEMVRLYTSGLSLADVGHELGFDAHTVLRRLRERGVTTRDSHGRPRI